MDNKSRIILAFIFVFLFIGQAFSQNVVQDNLKSEIQNNAKNEIQTQDDEFLRKKIAQMIMVGFNGQTLRADNPIYSHVKDLGIGGVILFSRNIDIKHPRAVKNIYDPAQLKRLTGDLQKIAPTPLLIAVDQEGGLVSRLSPSYFVVSTYTAKDLGNKDDLNLTYKEAVKTAKTLNEVGVNVNFAPCVDVELNPESKIIAKYRRSYSPDPNKVTAHAREVIKAHNKYNVLPVIKHFPGHGSALEDTHLGAVDITNSFDKKELIPYKKLISEDTKKGVMVAHVYNKNFDSEYPASLSKKIVSGMLKKDLGFTGLIFTDDIQMSAIRANYTLEKTLLNAINSGCDVIIIGNNISYEEDVAKNAVDTIYELVKKGEIKEERINESYRKILEAKGQHFEHN